MRLDKHRPYGHVQGLPGVTFAQDGHYFDGNGYLAPDPEAPSSEPASVPEQPAEDTRPFSVGPDDMRLKENKALKLQMENYGEPWQGAAHAREYLGIK
jgi:hypothetical protein